MAALGSVILYVRDIEETVAFYVRHFGFTPLRLPGDRLVELVNPKGGARLMIHAAAKSVKLGQVAVKLYFDVEDVAAFAADSAAKGLKFGPPHPADGYVFANAKDPSGNNIAISSRAFRKPSR